MPTKNTLHEDPNTDNSIEKYILQGWLPEKPFIGKNDLITTLGSCFADELIVYLKSIGYTTTEGLDAYISILFLIVQHTIIAGELVDHYLL
jgi:hypothetical protein